MLTGLIKTCKRLIKINFNVLKNSHGLNPFKSQFLVPPRPDLGDGA